MPKDEVPTLIEFARQERQSECSVCKLPEEARLQIPIARKKRIARETVFKFLHDVYGWEPNEEQYLSHGNGHHDRHLRELNGT